MGVGLRVGGHAPEGEKETQKERHRDGERKSELRRERLDVGRGRGLGGGGEDRGGGREKGREEGGSCREERDHTETYMQRPRHSCDPAPPSPAVHRGFEQLRDPEGHGTHEVVAGSPVPVPHLHAEPALHIPWLQVAAGRVGRSEVQLPAPWLPYPWSWRRMQVLLG